MKLDTAPLNPENSDRNLLQTTALPLSSLQNNPGSMPAMNDKKNDLRIANTIPGGSHPRESI